MKEYAFRLTKGQDLKKELEKFTKENNIKAGVIVSGVGSLLEVVIRNAGAKKIIKIKKNLEITSITGTLSLNGIHVHISVSDASLKTYGGHLEEGSLIDTTAEIVILELVSYKFKREIDNKTGYKELVISSE